MSTEIKQANSGEYLPEKPQKERRNEYAIRQSFIEQGHSKELSNAVLGYTPQDIPFVYATEPHNVTQGNSGRPMTSELWIGTTDRIENLHGEWSDQIPEVVVQWWGHKKLDEEESLKSVERMEIHHLPDGSFVNLEYRGVTEMGQFDGTLSSIEYYVPQEKFRPWGGKERNSYRIYYAHKNTKGDNMQNIPGGGLVRPEEKIEGAAQWSLDISRTDTGGTTILNGYGQILNFHMGEIHPVKVEYDKAFRYSALPKETPQALIGPETPVNEYKLLLSGKKDSERAMVESQLSRAKAMMLALAPMVIKVLASGGYSSQTEGMAIDGIMNHSEKIQILGRSLSGFTREQRFHLAQGVALAIKRGKFREWVAKLGEEKMQKFVGDTANRNAYHLLNWFMRVAPKDHDLGVWISEAEKVIFAKSKDQQIEVTPQFEKVFDGMCTSFVERFVEYVGQRLIGNTLD